MQEGDEIRRKAWEGAGPNFLYSNCYKKTQLQCGEKGFVIRKRNDKCKGKLTELAVVARKVIEKMQKAEAEEKAKQAKEVLIISDSDSDAAS